MVKKRKSTGLNLDLKRWLKNDTNRVENRGEDTSDLSPAEQSVLTLLTKDFLTVKKAASRRGTSVSAVYKIRDKLAKKGYLNKRNYAKNIGLKIGGTYMGDPLPKSELFQPSFPVEKRIRLHGQQFSIGILEKSSFYIKKANESDRIYLEGNTVMLYRGKLIIYCAPDRDFVGETPEEAVASSEAYWRTFFYKLENKLKVELVKGLNTRIRQVAGHFAEMNNGLAKECNRRHAKIKVKGSEDGKVWFLIDNSWNVDEAETIHPQMAKEDMEKTILPFFNDLRNNKHYLPSQVTEAISGLIRTQEYHAENIRTHVESIKKLAEIMERMEKKLGELYG